MFNSGDILMTDLECLPARVVVTATIARNWMRDISGPGGLVAL